MTQIETGARHTSATVASPAPAGFAPTPWRVPARARTVTIRPYFVCRLSGMPATALGDLRHDELVALLDSLMEVELTLAERADRLVEVLFDEIERSSKTSERSSLLRLKRDAFNHRGLDPDTTSRLRLDPALENVLEAYASAHHDCRALRQSIEDTHRLTTIRTRTQLKDILSSPAFRKALLLSSETLYRRLPSYLKSSDDAPPGRARRVERGLLRYLTRMCMKATPFSTFCPVIPGRIVDGPDVVDGLHLVGDPRAHRSFVRINKILCGILFEHLKAHAASREKLPVEPNPTLREEDGQLVFLISTRDGEVFQRLERNPVLDVIEEALRGKASVPLEVLLGKLNSDSRLDAETQEVEAYVARLVDIGYLRFRSGIREHDADWHEPFFDLMRDMGDESASRTRELLTRLMGLADAYGRAPVEDRAALLGTMKSEISDTLDALKAGERPIAGPRLPIYEDSSAPAELRIGLGPASSKAFDDLVAFVRTTLPLASPRHKQATMRHFFEEHYGEGRYTVPLLTFYEDFHREHLKEQMEKEGSPGSRQNIHTDGYDFANPFDLEVVSRIAEARRHLSHLVREAWRNDPDAEVVYLTRADVARAVAGVEAAVPPVSLSAFVQLVPSCDDEAPLLVLPAGRYHTGYGKFFSRFLYMLPDEMRARTLADNEADAGARLAELCGVSKFNANLHPPLLNWTIGYPTDDGGAVERRMDAASLDVARDPECANTLVLYDRDSGERVVPIDLGFLTRQMRPPLYQLLSHFASPTVFGVGLPESHLTPEERRGQPDSEAHASLRITHRPRLVYGNCLVLARRCWMVPAPLLPQPEPAETDIDFMVRLHRWRRTHRIPRRVFVRILRRGYYRHRPAAEARDGAPDNDGSARNDPGRDRDGSWRDLRKPQFIDFGSPLLVGLFTKIARSKDGFVAVLEEQLPDTAVLPSSGGDGYAWEGIVQIDVSGRDVAQ